MTIKSFVFLYLFFVIQQAKGQSTTGITHQPDTSFTTWSAYIKTIRNYPDISIVEQPASSGNVAQKKDITYCMAGIRKLKTDVFYPTQKDSNRHTAIIIIHGGGWRSGSRAQHHPLAQKLASLGYTCYTPEYRLSTEALFPAAIYDIKAAIRWVKKNAGSYGVDTNKIVVLGFSAGGEMATFAGTTASRHLFETTDCNPATGATVNAVIDIDGTLSFIHPESGEGDDSKRTSAATYWLGYPKKDNPDLWRDASPLTWVDEQTPPTLFINSGEKRMHAGREEYVQLLEKNNIYTEAHTFEKAPHSFCLFHPWFNPTVEYIQHFLQKVFPAKN